MGPGMSIRVYILCDDVKRARGKRGKEDRKESSRFKPTDRSLKKATLQERKKTGKKVAGANQQAGT